MIKAAEMQKEYRSQLNRVNAAHSSRIPVIEADRFINSGIDILFENLVSKFQNNATTTDHLRILENLGKKLKIEKQDIISDKGIFPEDLFLLTNQYVNVCKDNCDKEERLDIAILQSSDINKSLKDPNWKPSFAWEETVARIAGNYILVYHNCDFNIKEIIIDYVVRPNHIATPSFINNGGVYKKDGKTITKDIDFNIDNTFFWRKAVDIAVLRTLVSLGDKVDYQVELNKILTFDKIFI